MISQEKNRSLNGTGNAAARCVAIFGCLLAAVVGIMFVPRTTNAQVDCSTVLCDSTDQSVINGYDMFDDTNFASVVDGLGNSRQFYVHIPASYDTLPADQMMPVIFAFHGGGQDRMAMIDGKWGDDYFNQDIAFVIPLGEPDICDTSVNPERVWMQPGLRAGVPLGVALPANCDAATQKVSSTGTLITYWDASMPNTFRDVTFAENLRSTVLSRFPKLNPNKVYATGFSSGGGMSYSLLCYRANLFRGFSVVAKVLYGDSGRGDWDDDGIVETDANSLVATCGKTVFDPGHATGISTPRLWGYGTISPGVPPFIPPIRLRITKPVALFVGDQDTHYTLDEINQTGDEIRARNNLNGTFFILNPFSNVQNDDAQTQRRRFVFAGNPAQPFSAFSRYYVQRVDDGIAPLRNSAGHAMPDADETPLMTRDYNYTDETVIFLETYADLNLNP
jgi:dienelactone hydrolase